MIKKFVIYLSRKIRLHRIVLNHTSSKSKLLTFLMTLVTIVSGLATTSSADESLFGFSYGSDTLPAGASETAVWALNRWDKSRGKYFAQEIQLEYEYGITSRFSMSGYLLLLNLQYDSAWPKSSFGEDIYPVNRHKFEVQGFKTELKYNFLSVYTDGLGLSMTIEPLYVWRFRLDGKNTRQYELENKVILQKNFLDDQLVFIYNLGLETEVRTFPDTPEDAENELVITHSGGASYRFFPNMFAGIEFKDVRDILNGFKNNSAFFLGPNFHFTQKSWYLTIGYLRQIAGGPPYAYTAENGSPSGNYNYEERDLNELRIKIGFNL